MTERPDRYAALALQVDCDGVHPDRDRESAARRMQASLLRIGEALEGAQRWIGPDLKLVVLPEYILSGPPWGETIPEWAAKGAIAPDGPEYAALAALAQRHGVFLAGNGYETDRHFPGLYFQACWVFGPNGDRVLTYRRLISIFAPTPHDVWDKYLDIYGIEGVFPVADTAVGKHKYGQAGAAEPTPVQLPTTGANQLNDIPDYAPTPTTMDVNDVPVHNPIKLKPPERTPSESPDSATLRLLMCRAGSRSGTPRFAGLAVGRFRRCSRCSPGSGRRIRFGVRGFACAR